MKLQNLLQFQDGTAVETHEDWLRRREELKEVLQSVCYGTMPPPPEKEPVVVMTQPHFPSKGTPSCTTAQYVTYPFHDSDYGIAISVYLPKERAASESCPVVLCGDGCWQRVTYEFIELVTGRGYALCVFDRTAAAPDRTAREGESESEAFAALRESVLAKRYPELDFGVVAAWAWGFSRVMDAIAQIDCLDAGRVAVCGHSRGGKASLLAGAFDDRFAVVFTNGSGSGGSGSWLYQAEGAEPLSVITKVFPSWFKQGFSEYGGREKDLPFDSHFIKALCAPRPVVSSEGLADLWANPKGAWVSHLEARKLYKWLGGKDEHAAMHFRSGGHGHLLSDWSAMLDYCDWYYYNKPLPWDPLYSPYSLN